jgi:EAL and modified HD-GYP domain-containing signal transduction protein
MTMLEQPILGQLALNYGPLIGPKRTAIATRLTVSPARPGQALDAEALLDVVGEVWPVGRGDVILSVRSEALLADLMARQPTTNIVLELPAFMAGDSRFTRDIRMLHVNGVRMLLAGRTDDALGRELLPCFQQAIIDLDDEQRADSAAEPGTGGARRMGFFQGGVHTVADMERAFARGAQGVLGWPIDGIAVTASGTESRRSDTPDLQVIVELIRKVDQQEDIDKIEATLRRDPTLAFKLMRQINSPAFGLSVEITSFSHAVMLLGYQRLKRWLALLLATASKDANLRPLMYAAVRRALLMEELGAGGDSQQRGELFICGVFSLLDRMFGQPFDKLLRTIPVPEQVYLALAEGGGPYEPYLSLVQAIEQGTGHDVVEGAQRAMLEVEAVNRALLKALSNADQVE